ncbi:MAG TPA: PAS domain S-box protein, partial [Terracidiphilus sp.]
MASRSEFEIFDRNPDPALDELTELAAVLCNADYAYIGSMDVNRLWFKSQFGFEAPEQRRSSTACQWMLEKGQPLLIRDAGRDARFPPTGIPLIGAKACRSYAGVPLLTSSRQVVGTLAVLAREAGRFSQEHVPLLEVLGRQVVTRLELYTRITSQEQALQARQRAERALSNERLFVTAALDSIPFLAALLHKDGRIVQLNYPCMQLTGLTLADAVGHRFVELVLEADYRAWAAARLRDTAAGQVSGPHETAWRTRGGETRRVSWTLRPLPGPDGVIQYLIVSGQDITGQRQAELNLLVSETRYEQLVENSLGFLFTCTLEGWFTSLNAYTAETLGYRVKDLSGRSVASFLDRDSEASFKDCLHTLETNDEWQGALSLRRSDGVYRRIAFRSRLMQLPGERPFVLNHGIDVTELYEA